MRALFSRPARLAALCVSGLAISASSAHAQDSISSGSGPNGLPGDAISPYATSQQVLRYAVDLTPKASSLGSSFVIGPVVKASRSIAGGYFDQLIGAQSASARFRPAAAPYSSGAYSLWTNTPGAGINTGFNLAPSASLSGLFSQGFGLGFMEFGAGADAIFSTADDENAIVGGLINFTYRNPNRLLVVRTVAAVSKGSSTANSTAAFGLGSVDESGFMHLYADDYSLVSPSRLTQRNAVRVNQLTRTSTALNNIFQAGSPSSGDTASTSFVRTQQASMVVPAMIARSASGALNRPVLLTTDLASNLIIETKPTVTVVPAASYLPAGSSGPRGAVAFIPQAFGPTNASGTALGTAATLCRTDTNTRTRGISIFGITQALGIDSRIALSLPTSSGDIVDADDGFAPGTTLGPIAAHEFTNYASQTSFRGSSSQVAMTVLSTGDLLVASLVAATGGGTSVPQGQDNYIAIAHIPAGGGSATWSVAAYVGQSTTPGTFVGKPILGRATPGGPVASIGRLARFTEAYGSASTGPSISSPAMDRFGNLYFLATIALDNAGGGTSYSTGLLKATRDLATGAYTLELLAKLGDIVAGRNSGLNYQIQYLGVADTDSVDSGSIFSTNIVQDQLAGVSSGLVTPASPMSLGALTFKAKIVYDVNADNAFVDPSGAGSGSTSPDQAYNVVMALMPRVLAADFNRDGSTNIDDIFIFLNAWFAGAPGADWDANGVSNIDDIFIYLNDWFAAGT